jgi:hypothetical protein
MQQGQPVPIDIFAYGESENMRPEPFRARFTPRSPERRKAILMEADKARGILQPFEGETKVVLEPLEV